jgi:hypothetical protein
VLPAKFSLRDCDDVEALARRALNAQLKASEAKLDHWATEDAVAYLLEAAIKFERGYDESRTSASFSNNLYCTLRFRTVDFLRVSLGRTKWSFSSGYVHVRERPVPLSLDAERERGAALGESLPGSAGDGSPGRDEAPLWLHNLGDQSRSADTAILRAESRRRARDRARRQRANRG